MQNNFLLDILKSFVFIFLLFKLTILLSGERPFSFSMATLAKVSIEALPVILPMPNRDTSLSTSADAAKKFKKKKNEECFFMTV